MATEKKKIRMTETRLGSPDGVTVREYAAGETYDVPAALADVFMGEGWAAPATAKVVEHPASKRKKKVKTPTETK